VPINLVKPKTILLLIWAIAQMVHAGERAAEYRNPIVRGNWPDPGVIRVGEDYYSVSSTSGWQPGVRVIHSKDLVHWEYIGYAYAHHPDIRTGTTRSGCYGLEMGYNPNTRMYLIYAPLANRTLFVYYSRSPQGPYSVKNMGRLGIDPGFFADDDGRLYLITYRGDLCELTEDGLSIKRKVTKIDTTGLKFFEGPDIFKRNGYYYILYSDGGTRPHQPSTIDTLRAKNLSGPWERDPKNPRMFSTDNGAAFQGPAHGTLVHTQNGEWFVTYHAHELSHYSLGRQLCMEPVEWTDDGWWRPKNGRVPSVKNRKPNLPDCNYELAQSDDFEKDRLGLQWFFHCKPDFSGESWSLTEQPGCLRIKTRPGDISAAESITNVFLQRVTLKRFEFTTKVAFDATEGNEAAGLHMYHDQGMNFWLVTTIRDGKKVFEVGKYNNGRRSMMFRADNTIGTTVHLRIMVDGHERATFYYGADGTAWQKLGKSIYFGDSWMDLRNGEKGDPDLGWVGIRKRNAWSATTFGLFAVRDGAKRSRNADFSYFRVTASQAGHAPAE